MKKIDGKKIFIIILALILMVTPPTISYKKASASDPFTLMALGGFTLGGVAGIVLPLAALGLGIYCVVDNWEAVSGTVTQAWDKASGSVKEWYDGLKNDAINIDTGTTYQEDLANNQLKPSHKYKANLSAMNDALNIPTNVIDFTKDVIKRNILNGEVKVEGSMADYLNSYFTNYSVAMIDHVRTKSIHNNYVMTLSDDEFYNGIFNSDISTIYLSPSKGANGNIMLKPWLKYAPNTEYNYIGYASKNVHPVQMPVLTDMTFDDGLIPLSKYGYEIPYNYNEYVVGRKALPLGWINKLLDAFYNNYVDHKLLFTSVPFDFTFVGSRENYSYLGEEEDIKVDSRVANPDIFGDTEYEEILVGVGDIMIRPNDVLNDILDNGLSLGYENTDAIIRDIIDADRRSTELGLDRLTNLEIDMTDVEVPVPSEKDYTDQLDNIYTGIKDLPISMSNAIENMLTKNPNISESNKNKIMQVMTMVDGKTSLFNYPLKTLIKFFTLLSQIENIDCIINFPKIEYSGFSLYSGTSLNLSAIIRKSEFSDIYAIYRIVTNAYISFMFLNFIIKKSKTFFSPSMGGD